MRHALVIGNSDGIGLALTELLLDKGFAVVGVSRSPSRIEAHDYEHHVSDVCSPQYEGHLTELCARHAFDVCVYCVGTGQFLALPALTGERRVFETNLLGAVTTLELVLPAMLARGQGHVVGLSSQADSVIDSAAPSYAASKAGLSSYLEGLALACRARGVFITNLRFGFVDTKLAKAATRPFMITPRKAAERVWHCLEKRPLRDTFPRRMAALLFVFRMLSAIRRWFI